MQSRENNLTYYAVLLTLFLVPLVYFKTYFGPLPISIEIIMIPLVTLAAFIDYYRKDLKVNKLPIWPMLVAFGLFFVISILSLIKAVSLAPAVMEMLRYVSYVFLFTIVAKVNFTKEQYVNFAKSFGASIIIVGLFGALQYVFGFSLNTAGLYALKEAKGRVDSTLVNPNYYSAFLNYLAPMILLFAVVYFKDKKVQLFLFAVYAIFVINLILTYTRAAWVTMACAFILMVILMPKEFIRNFIKPHILISFMVLLTFVYFMPDFQSRTYSAIYAIEKLVFPNAKPGHFAGGPGEDTDGDGVTDEEEKEQQKEDATTNRAVVSRMTLWKTGWVMLKENPVLGVGVGNYSERYKEYVTKYPKLYIGHESYSVHNSYLKVGAETGFTGLIAFLAIYITFFLYIVRLYFNQNLLGKVLAVGLFVGSVTYMVQNLSNNLIFIPQLNTIFWLVGGLTLAFLYKNKHEQKQYL
jgi:putative inorganic carbon (hco3(-)) transporter